MPIENRDRGRPELGPLGLPGGPAPWPDSLLALGPFLFVPALLALGWIVQRLGVPPDSPQSESLALGQFLLVFLLEMALLAFSVIRGLPRWSFPHWAFAFAVTVILAGPLAGAGIEPAWLVWLPFALVFWLAAFWLGVQGRPAGLPAALRRDATLLSFAVYGLLPLLLLFSYDEVHDAGPYVFTWLFILAAGAVAYMRCAAAWQRVLALLGGFLLAWVPASIHLARYWDGRGAPWPGAQEVMGNTLLGGLAAMLCLLAPWLLVSLVAAARASPAPR